MRDDPVLKNLQNEPHEVIFKPHGNSMTPKIDSGDQVKVKQVSDKVYQVGDIVYCKVKGSYYLHLITAIDETKQRYQISNNSGHVNGWTTIDKIYGLCVQVKDKILVSDEEILKRSE